LLGESAVPDARSLNAALPTPLVCMWRWRPPQSGEGEIVYEKFIARQPIFDEKLRVFAYELLFRAGGDKKRLPAASGSLQQRDCRLHDAVRPADAHGAMPRLSSMSISPRCSTALRGYCHRATARR